MFAFFSGSPFVYIEVYGVPAEHYGLLFALNVVGLIACATANSRLVTRVGSRRMLSIGTAIVFVAGLALLATGLTGFGGLVGIVVPLFFFIGSLNLIGANAVALTLSHFPHVAGTAAASFGITQFTMGAVVGAIVGQLHDGTALPMCATIAGCGIVSFTARHLIAARAPDGPVVD
jgi:DHA1 family bicyclomycin/chloramphenicol resistance-like MFS transporter